MRIATSFLTRRGRILILRRSHIVEMPGLWGGISGAIEGGEEPLSRARAEMYEEAGVEDARLLRAARMMVVESGGRRWEVYPFLFGAAGYEIRLNRESIEYKWIRRDELEQYETVPDLGRVLDALSRDNLPS